MDLANTTIYVDDVAETLNFYKQAFGITTALLDDSGQYGELATGQVKLAFAAHPLAHSNFKQGYIRSHPKQPALGFEVTFNCTNVEEAYQQAVEAGAEPLTAPTDKPMGGKVAYVRSIEGTLIELRDE